MFRALLGGGKKKDKKRKDSAPADGDDEDVGAVVGGLLDAIAGVSEEGEAAPPAPKQEQQPKQPQQPQQPQPAKAQGDTSMLGFLAGAVKELAVEGTREVVESGDADGADPVDAAINIATGVAVAALAEHVQTKANRIPPPAFEPTAPPQRAASRRLAGAVPTRPGLRVLSIDGGGVRGLIPLYVLRKLEQVAQRPICELFDIVAGTSIGGIIACSLTMPDAPGSRTPKMSVAALYKWFKEQAPVLFPPPSENAMRAVSTLGGMTGTMYEDSAIETALKKFFGSTWLSEAICDTIITTYEASHSAALLFKSRSAWENKYLDFPMWQVTRATSAAPTYYNPFRVMTQPEVTAEYVILANNFKNFKGVMPTVTATPNSEADRTLVLVDGGLIANNPGMCACAEVLANYRVEGWVKDESDVFMLSLGTGWIQPDGNPAFGYNWGALQWIQPLLSIMMDGAATLAAFQLHQMLDKDKFFRMDVGITPSDADKAWLRGQGASDDDIDKLGKMDNPNKYNIMFLERLLDAYFAEAETQDAFARLVQHLLEPRE